MASITFFRVLLSSGNATGKIRCKSGLLKEGARREGKSYREREEGGDRREDIFADDQGQCFVATLGQARERTGWLVHAYCLMSNHFHLVVETPQPNSSDGMKWLWWVVTSSHTSK